MSTTSAETNSGAAHTNATVAMAPNPPGRKPQHEECIGPGIARATSQSEHEERAATTTTATKTIGPQGVVPLNTYVEGCRARRRRAAPTTPAIAPKISDSTTSSTSVGELRPNANVER
jgi:hypothetical protein